MIEGTDFELILDETDEERWAVRLLTGKFPETVLRFGAIAVNEVDDNLSFNFHVIQSPDPDAHIDNEELQMVAAEALSAVFDICAQEGAAKFTDRETGEELEIDEVVSYGTER